MMSSNGCSGGDDCAAIDYDAARSVEKCCCGLSWIALIARHFHSLNPVAVSISINECCCSDPLLLRSLLASSADQPSLSYRGDRRRSGAPPYFLINSVL